MATQKQVYLATELLPTAQILTTDVMDKIDDIVATYFDNTYNVGGANEITQADIDLAPGFEGLTVAQVTNIITAFQNLSLYFNNGVPAQADYAVSYNNVRNARLG